MFSTYVMFNSFLASDPRDCAPSPDPGGVIIHYTRLVQCHLGVQSFWSHRRADCDLGDQTPPPTQGVGEEKDIGTSLQLLHLGCEPAPKPPPCQPHLCGQQPSGQENCLLRYWGNLCPWWVQPARGEEHFQSSVSTEVWEFRALLPTVLLALPSI